MDNKITYKINTENAIDVEDLVDSLLAIKNQYLKSTNLNDVEVKISEVRKGSFEFDFIIETMVGFIPIMETYNVAYNFITNLKNMLTIGDENKKDINLNDNEIIENLTDIQKIIKPISSDKTASIQIINHGDMKINVNITNADAKNFMDYTNDIFAKEHNEEEQKSENRVLLKQQIIPIQLRGDGKKGYKIKCKKVSSKELPATFKNDFLSSVITDKESPFDYIYVADLEVEYVKNKPKSCTILNFHDAFKNNKKNNKLFSNTGNE